MKATQQIFRVRREYNIWAGNETLEDYALRFTAKKARRWRIEDVAKTALGATAFMALEAIGAAMTLSYGFTNAVAAMVAVALVIVITGFPVVYNAARHGLDMDLLTRGAGFGYLGSTVTSLIYASFTFIFFAIEGVILAAALQAMFGMPLWLGYILCSVAVIPIVTHGITAISKFQIGTQNFWLTLQIAALIIVGWYELDRVADWSRYMPEQAIAAGSTGFDVVMFGAAAAIMFALVAQIGEQVDYLRFLPPKTRQNRHRWWFWMSLAGPGWILIGLVKMLLGSFLAYIAISAGASAVIAADPTYMYQMVFNYAIESPTLALMLAGTMVIISQMKINVTNAYAGSIAWSNFFSRLTHSHPGRVVWLIFNVAIALILMELGMYEALESILGLFAIVAVSWLGCLSADLMINKPLKLSPSHVEFKRAHLYDINPVGVISMALASVIGIVCYLGLLGEVAGALAHFIALAVCFICVPLIAVLTRSRYYLARQSPEIDELIQMKSLHVARAPATPGHSHGDDAGTGWTISNDDSITLECCICENTFEREDMSYCPAYGGAICSLCCSLDSRCMDVCKTGKSFTENLGDRLSPWIPAFLADLINPRLARFTAILTVTNLISAALLSLIHVQMQPLTPSENELLTSTLVALFFILMIIIGVICWLFLLAHESRMVAQQESSRQTMRLMQEIEAHNETDIKLQHAKDLAERANSAKSRYLTGISHELRTPLQAILGYAQLLGQRADLPKDMRSGMATIRRSGEHLAGLIEGLLDISKIEAGRLDIYRNRVNLPDLIEQLVSMFREMAQDKGIAFSCEVHGALPDYVTTDEKRLRQILINLLSNAIKYTERGRVEFHVRYRNQVAEFSIIDTGIGIHNDNLQRILDPFERVRGPDSPSVSGTGLGLTIVRLLTEIMGGDLEITSTPGRGSCFKVSLMLSRVDTPAEKILPARQITGYQGEPKVVMVVDDEPIHRGLLSDLLTPLGFITFEAHDAKRCLDALDDITPDIFLLDVNMAGTDGMMLARMLRQRGFRQPVIMISADAQERHRLQHDKQWHDDYLVKPINNQDLLDRMGQLLALKWTYVDEAVQREAEPDTGKLIIDRNLIDHALVRELLAYAQIGYKRGVSEKLDELEKTGLLDALTLEQFRRLVGRMELQRLVSLIENDDTAGS